MTPSDEAAKARALARMRWLAGGLLVLMLGLFLAASLLEARHPAFGYLRAFAEAAMVGGLADWFAVTALFRHPFGLPIPHTAIVPRNKERIGDSLGGFVANNFLTPEVVLPKIKSADIAGRLATWLAEPASARFVARRITAAILPLMAAISDEPVARLLRDATVARLRALDAATLAARVLEVLTAGGQHMALFDIGIDVARRFLAENQETIYRKVSDKSKWWVPDWLDARLAARIVTGAEETLDEMRAADHPWRLQFEQAVLARAERLLHSDEAKGDAAALKNRLIDHPDVQSFLLGLWRQLKAALEADLVHGDRIERVLAAGVAGFGDRLAADPKLHEVVNGWLSRAVLHMVVPNRQRLGAFMAGVVRNWDTRTLVGKLELQVGRDLQYIRINGTLVGGMVGLAIHALWAALLLP